MIFAICSGLRATLVPVTKLNRFWLDPDQALGAVVQVFDQDAQLERLRTDLRQKRCHTQAVVDLEAGHFTISGGSAAVAAM